MATQKTLIIVTEIKSHMLSSIVEHLNRADYQTTLVPADIDAINGVCDVVGGILLFASDELIGEYMALLFIKDKAAADNIPIFAIGTREELNVIKDIIPEHFIQKEFVRPLSFHVSVLVKDIDSIFKHKIMQKKILLVDDSGPMLRTVKSWLEDKYSIFLANSGAMAIKYLTLNRPDLILLDYEMPVADGRQILEMLRAEAEFNDIPVIFLTNKNDPESIKNVAGLNPEGYLLKTMEPGAIINSIDEFFMKRAYL